MHTQTQGVSACVPVSDKEHGPGDEGNGGGGGGGRVDHTHTLTIKLPARIIPPFKSYKLATVSLRVPFVSCWQRSRVIARLV